MAAISFLKAAQILPPCCTWEGCCLQHLSRSKRDRSGLSERGAPAHRRAERRAQTPAHFINSGGKQEPVASPPAPHPQHPPRGPSCLGLLLWISKTQLLEPSPNTRWLHQRDILTRLINPSARQGFVRSEPASGSPSWAASKPGRAQVPGSSSLRGCRTQHLVPICATG